METPVCSTCDCTIDLFGQCNCDRSCEKWRKSHYDHEMVEYYQLEFDFS